jgi:hypothetical protein
METEKRKNNITGRSPRRGIKRQRKTDRGEFRVFNVPFFLKRNLN